MFTLEGFHYAKQLTFEDHLAARGPFLWLFLLSWVIYGLWVWDLFRPVAQWNPAQMVRYGLCLCLLNIAISTADLSGIMLVFWVAGITDPRLILLRFIFPMLFMGIFALQLLLYATLLWWRTSRKPAL